MVPMLFVVPGLLLPDTNTRVTFAPAAYTVVAFHAGMPLQSRASTRAPIARTAAAPATAKRKSRPCLPIDTPFANHKSLSRLPVATAPFGLTKTASVN
jgi:hypothetical protein